MNTVYLDTNYYSDLGVASDATQAEIAQAFRRLARQHHPDTAKQPDPDAFQQASEAYSVLSDPWERDRYDRSRQVRHMDYQRFDHTDLAEADRWVGHYRMTMSAGGFDLGMGSMRSSWADGARTALSMNPWWHFYRSGSGLRR